MRYSLIIPVFNRPGEIEELLKSLTEQKSEDFEVVVVEDGSSIPCRDVVERYSGKLDLKYFFKENGGPGPARNFGARKAGGEYLIFLDSDCCVPPDYLMNVGKELERKKADAFGGPDRADASYSPTQKAINYSMTSFFTTGGIRGGKKKLDKFYPRSFNMGISSELFGKLGGFSDMRFGEDIDLSIRIFESGAECRLFPEAWVWHKRRTDFKKFFKQVHNSGIARINLWKRHPGSLKPVHTFPALFTLSCVTVILPVLYANVIFIDSSVKNRDLRTGFLSVPAAFIQLTGYGTGFIRAWWRRCVKGEGEFSAFVKNFYN